MSGSCRVRDAGPAVILAVARPAPTGCLPALGRVSQPSTDFGVFHFGAFVTIATVAKALCEAFHIVLRPLALDLAHRESPMSTLGGIGSSSPGPKPNAVEWTMPGGRQACIQTGLICHYRYP